MYSDNGSNFIGASNELKELGQFLKAHKSTIMQQLGLDLDIKWHFIPAYSLHQGGIWEAGVKSAKHLLVRTLVSSPRVYTLEALYTLIC